MNFLKTCPKCGNVLFADGSCLSCQFDEKLASEKAAEEKRIADLTYGISAQQFSDTLKKTYQEIFGLLPTNYPDKKEGTCQNCQKTKRRTYTFTGYTMPCVLVDKLQVCKTCLALLQVKSHEHGIATHVYLLVMADEVRKATAQACIDYSKAIAEINTTTLLPILKTAVVEGIKSFIFWPRKTETLN